MKEKFLAPPKPAEMFLDESLFALEVEAARQSGEKRERKAVMATINTYLKTPEGKKIQESLSGSESDTRTARKSRRKELSKEPITEIRGFEELGLRKESLETYFKKGFPHVVESIRFTTEYRPVRDEDHMKSGTEVTAAYSMDAGSKSGKITVYGSMLDRHGRPEVYELFNDVIPHALAHGTPTPESDFDWVDAMDQRQQSVREMRLEVRLRDLHRAAELIASREARDLVEGAIERLILPRPVKGKGMATERGTERLRPLDLPAYQELRRILEQLDELSALQANDADIDSIVSQIDHYRQIARHAGPEHVDAAAA